jgi:small subunit ribosomal protein S6
MTRPYELVYIFDSTLEEAQVNERLESFHSLLKTSDVPEPTVAASHWGKRTLAYPIRGKETGYYVVEQFDTDPALLGELERAIKLDETVLRYLLVLNEGLAPVGASASTEPESEGAAPPAGQTPEGAAAPTGQESEEEKQS